MKKMLKNLRILFMATATITFVISIDNAINEGNIPPLSLTTLPGEIMSKISTHLHNTDLKSLRLTSRALKPYAQECLYQKNKRDFGNRESFESSQINACVSLVKMTDFLEKTIDLRLFSSTPDSISELLNLFKVEKCGASIEALKISKYTRNEDLHGDYRGGGGIGDRGAFELSSSPYLFNLQQLNLQENNITLVGMNHLLASPHLTALHTLNLKKNSITPIIDDKVNPLRLFKPEAPKVIELLGINLTELDISYNLISDVLAKELSTYSYLFSLNILNLGGNPLGKEGIDTIIRSEGLPNLKKVVFPIASLYWDGKKRFRVSKNEEDDFQVLSKQVKPNTEIYFQEPIRPNVWPMFKLKYSF